MRAFLLHIALLLCAGLAFGQGLAGRRALPLPNCYQTVYENTPITGNGDCVYDDYNDVWVVYAVNEGAVTSTGQRLAFMDAFFVLEDDGQRLHVVKHDPVAITRQKMRYLFTANAEDYGWVAKNEVVLWPNALESAQNGQFLQVVSKHPQFQVYTSSSMRGARAMGNGSGILWVLKAENGKILLSRSPWLSISPEKTQQLVLGWAYPEDFVRLENRVAFEPALSPAAVAERKRQSVRALAFASVASAMAYQQTGEVGSDIVWDADPLSTTWPVTQQRLFLLAPTRYPGVYAVGYILSTGGFLQGYLSVKCADLHYPVFGLAVMLEQNELGEMIGRFSNLTLPGIPSSQRREKLYTAILELANEHKIDQAEMIGIKMFLCELISLPAACCDTNESKIVSNVQINKIINPKYFADDQISKFILYIADKVERLENYANDDKNRFIAGEKPYYWVPLSLLP